MYASSKERLNICLPDMQRKGQVTSNAMTDIMRRTAWDTTIQITPFFLLANSMPFPIIAYTWQFPKKEEDDSWKNSSHHAADDIHINEEATSSDEDLSSTTPSTKLSSNPDQFHQPSGSQSDYSSLNNVDVGQTLRLSGVNLQQPLFIQVSQRLQVHNESELMWSKPLQIKLAKLRTGINPKGSFTLPTISLEMGNDCSALVDVSIEREIRVPILSIYSPYWVMNKTGAKLEYKIKASAKKVRFCCVISVACFTYECSSYLSVIPSHSI